jgi:hypothetical protein
MLVDAAGDDIGVVGPRNTTAAYRYDVALAGIEYPLDQAAHLCMLVDIAGDDIGAVGPNNAVVIS